MIRLAPNVFVLEYLNNAKQLSGASEGSVYRFIQSGTLSDEHVEWELGLLFL